MTASKYPQNLDDDLSLPNAIDNVTAVTAAVVNRLKDAIIAVEKELGTDPSSTFGTVKARLDALATALAVLETATGADTTAVINLINSHIADLSNPHQVTAAQVGAIGAVTSTDEAVARFNLTSGAIQNSANGPFVRDSGELNIINNIALTGKDSGGTAINLIKINGSDQLIIAASGYETQIASTLGVNTAAGTLPTTGSIRIPSGTTNGIYTWNGSNNVNLVNLTSTYVMLGSQSTGLGTIIDAATGASVIIRNGNSGTITVTTSGLEFAKGVTATISQADNTTNGATASALTIQAQDATGTTSIGAALNLKPGSGTLANGVLNLQDGDANTIATINEEGLGLTERSGDPTPVANTGFLYPKDADGITELYYENSDGYVTQLTRGGSIGDFLNVKDFGATGDGVTDDTAAIQATIDYIVNTGVELPIFFPAGTYIVDDGYISLPVSIQGLEIYGAGRDESTGLSSTIRNNSTNGHALFITSGTGTFSYFQCHDMRFLQSASAGYYFQFDNLTTEFKLYNVHMNMSNTEAGAVLMNGVENHLNWIHDCKVVTNGATVPMFWWDGPAASNMTTTTFERVTINSPNSTAPQYLIDHKHTNAATGFRFLQLNIEQPDGGGVHLYGISGALLESCICSDSSSITEPVFMIDRIVGQSYLDCTVINCRSFVGTASVPDLELRNSPGTPGIPGPFILMGCRFSYVTAAIYSRIYSVFTTTSLGTSHAGVFRELAERGTIAVASTPYTAGIGTTLLVNAASSNITINLPTALIGFDNRITVKKTDSSLNTVTIDPDGAETIDGQSSFDLNFQYDSITVISDGTQWYIL